MKVTWSGVGMTNGSGRLNGAMGGNVVQKNGRVRAFAMPTNPQTAYQIGQRATFSEISQAWSGTLTQAQRDAWNAAAATSPFFTADPLTGTPKALTGKALFEERAGNTALAGVPLSVMVDEGPQNYANIPNGITSVTADASGGTIAVVLDSDTEGAGSAYLLYMSKPESVGTSKARNLKMVAMLAGTTPEAVGPAYVTRFGAITGQTGKKIFYRFEAVQLTSGNKTLLSSGSTVIVA